MYKKYPRLTYSFLLPGAKILHFFCSITPGEQFSWDQYFDLSNKKDIPSLTPWTATLFWIICGLLVHNFFVL
jgi:hypothetical protein